MAAAAMHAADSKVVDGVSALLSAEARGSLDALLSEKGTPAKAACPGYASRRRGLAAALECIKPAIRQARDAGLEVEVQKVVRPAGSTLI